MEIERINISNNEVVLKLKGCLDTAATQVFTSALENANTSAKITIDAAELDFIASSALRSLVATKKLRGDALTISIINVNDVIREVFSVTGLDSIFEIKSANN